MFLTAFRLARDHHTEGQSFGYQRAFWPDETRVSHYTPPLGCPLEVDTRLVTKMIKMIECYHRAEGLVVVERLSWDFQGRIYPYRAKYIYHEKRGYTAPSFLFLPNMGTIHRGLTGIDTIFASPLQYYLNTRAQEPWHNPESRDAIFDVYDSHRKAIDGLAGQAMLDLLETLDHEYPRDVIETTMQNFIPRLPIAEPISGTSWYGPIRMRDIALGRPTLNPFDTSPVGELVIHHPEVTLYSPPECHSIAAICEEINQDYTDVKIEYILSEGQTANQCVHHMVSRYRANPSPELLLHNCTHIAVDAWCIARARCTTGHFPKTIILLFQLSYGDEALIEIFTIDRRHCLCVIHIDLALLALCASSVIAQSTLL